jgi:hypothetical protein
MSRRRWIYLFALTTLVGVSPAQAQTDTKSITLSWTTPGDDGVIGTASEFDLRYSTSPISASNFASATRWTSMPTPAAPGTRQNTTITGLLPSTTYYFALKTADDYQNWSGISNVVSQTTPNLVDVTRPAPIAMQVSSLTDTTVTLSWTAVGDDSLTGTATSYDIRYSTSPITNSTWNSATAVTGEPAPDAPGTVQSYLVQNLNRQTFYYFAIRATDDGGNTSALSNIPTVTTPDSVPPAAVSDLSFNFLWMGWHSAAAVRPGVVEVSRP